MEKIEHSPYCGNNRNKPKIRLKFMLMAWTVFFLSCLLLVCSMNEHRFNVAWLAEKKKQKAHWIFFVLFAVHFLNYILHFVIRDEIRWIVLIWTGKNSLAKKRANVARIFIPPPPTSLSLPVHKRTLMIE